MQLVIEKEQDVLCSHANLSSPPLKFRLSVLFLLLLPHVRRMLGWQSLAFGDRFAPS